MGSVDSNCDELIAMSDISLVKGPLLLAIPD